MRTSIAGITDEADLKLLNGLVDLLNENRKENWIDLHNVRTIKYGEYPALRLSPYLDLVPECIKSA